MNDQRTQLRSIAWLDLCPWLLLLRCPGLALRVETIFLAAVGGGLMWSVWWVGDTVFPAETDIVISNSDVVPPTPAVNDLWQTVTQPGQASPAIRWPAPLMRVLSLDASPAEIAHVACCGVLTLLIWSIIGGAITRSAAVQLARDQRIGLGPSLSFAFRKLASFFFAPLFPLLGVAFFVIGVLVIVGLPMNLDLGLVWAGLVWIFVLLFGILVGVVLLGLVFGWPLMWGTISSEGSDAFDALSRSYAYTLQRPLHYLFYVVVAGVLGALIWSVVLIFGEAVIQLCLWSADWGVFNELRMTEIVAAANGQGIAIDDGVMTLGGLGQAGATLIGVLNTALRLVTFSFIYGYFWVAASAMYLLLRRDVDHTETDEVYLEDDSESYGLPPLKDDEAGVPDIAEDAADSA